MITTYGEIPGTGVSQEKRTNAQAVGAAGKRLLGIDYDRQRANVIDGCHRQRRAGFVPCVTEVALDAVGVEFP